MQPKISVLMNDILHSVDIRRNIFKFKTNDKKQILQRRVNINKRNLTSGLKHIHTDAFIYFINTSSETRYSLLNDVYEGRTYLQTLSYNFKIRNRILREKLRIFMRRVLYRYKNKIQEDRERLEKAICILCKYCNNPKKNFTCIVRKAYYDALEYDIDDVYDDSKYYTGSIFKKIRIKKADRKEIIKDELYEYFTKGFITKCYDDWIDWLD